MGWNALRQSEAESNGRSSPPIMSLLPTSPPSPDAIYFRKVDKLDRPPVENGLRHVDGFDQIFGCSFAHQPSSPIARTSPRRGSPRGGGAAETLSAQRCTVRFAVTAGGVSLPT